MMINIKHKRLKRISHVELFGGFALIPLQGRSETRDGPSRVYDKYIMCEIALVGVINYLADGDLFKSHARSYFQLNSKHNMYGHLEVGSSTES